MNQVEQTHPGAVVFIYVKPVLGEPRIITSSNIPDSIHSDVQFTVFTSHLESYGRATTKQMAERDTPLPETFDWSDVHYILFKKVHVDVVKMFFRKIKDLISSK